MDTQLPRKYRPIQLEHVVGQEHVVETLKKASVHSKFSQAYLFAGTRGCGKTSMARILATLVNCEDPKDGKTCGKCYACKAVPAGATLDIRELDGASNNSVEQARDLKDAASYSPHELKRKVYIIDECHMLTKAANNALLKVVEEPPSYLTFVFCTTEPWKILPTIISRCQRYNFKRINSKDIAKRLKLISKKEEINIDDDALFTIAKIARGSMRDAISCLEQIGTVGIDKHIKNESVERYYGVVDRKGILDMVKAIKANNIALILDQVNDMVMASADSREIMFEVAEVFRNIMVMKIQNNTKLIDLPEAEIEELQKIGEGLTVSQLLKLAHLFADIEKKLTFNINERWVMEATLINCVASLRKTKPK
jgi:DNA polymerase-3 subunit gamma/tau